jgi:hypothetical protein
LSEVLKELGRSARDIDPNKIGVNFVISSAEPIRKGAEDDSYAWVDGATGQSAARRAKLEDFRVIIDPPLRNATLREILDTIVKVAKPPAGANPNAGIAYSIEDYAVVFHRAAPPALYTRTFRVNPNLFLRNFESATNTTVIEAIRKFMVGAGIDFGPEAQTDQSDQNGKPGQKAMFYNHKTGALMVRASLQDLDKIENALQRLSMSPPQVTIDARFIEFESGAEKQKEMLLGSMHTNVNSVFTLSQFMNDQQFQTVIKALDRGTAVQNAQAGPALIGILTARQRDRILNKLKKADGVTMADAPRVTTLSGRGAVISVEPGPAIAVLPEIEADRKTIRLSAEIQMPGNPKQGERVAKMGAKERLWDGQTLVLQPLDGENQNKVILITPTQVDPAGNRVVQEADIPEGVPQQ